MRVNTTATLRFYLSFAFKKEDKSIVCGIHSYKCAIILASVSYLCLLDSFYSFQ